MPRETFGQYLRGSLARHAEILTATVKSTKANGNYLVTLDRTATDIEATLGFPSPVALPVGRKVLLSRVDGSGSGVGNGYVIVSLGPILSRNSSNVTSLSTSHNHEAETLGTIFSGGVPVSSIQLARGGAASGLLCYGARMVSAALYGHVNIVDDVAQVITAALITLQVKAQVGCPVGLYPLTVGGQTLENFFEVI